MKTMLLTAVSTLVLSSSLAFAQAQTPAKAAKPAPAATPAAPATSAPAATPAPATPAPRTAANPLPSNVPHAAVPARGAAPTPQAAAQAHTEKMREREAACNATLGKKWKPDHKVGDANPNGGFYTTNYNGGCTSISLKEGLASGKIQFVGTAPAAAPGR